MGYQEEFWIGADDDESLRSLKAASAAGVNFFDTALAYGDGHSEQLIARALGKSSEIIIASKVPPKDRVWPVEPGSPVQNTFPGEYVRACLEKTLKNLGRRSVDVYQFHICSGKARFVGISIQNHQPANVIKALDTGLVDTVQVIYIFDQSPEDELFPYCQEHGIGVIVRVPFDEGSLTGKILPDTVFPEGDFRNIYFKENRKQKVWERVQLIVRD